ncbi:MAG: TrkA C-terminal domain-containing protein [Promethearchaeota archaeon]
MKQNIDLMIDLAYSAIKFGSKDLAEETYKIEKRIHELTFLLNMQIIQTNAGGVKEAKKLEPIIVMGYSIDKISDALADIAQVVNINSDITQFTTLFWDYVPEPIVKVTVNKGCDFIGQSRADVHFRSKHGVDLIAILRNNKFIFRKNEKILDGDVLIVKGEKEPLRELKVKCCDSEKFSFDLEKEEEEPIFDLDDPDIKTNLIDLKKMYIQITDISETMTELALAALFFNNYELAEDVLEMEELMDGLNINFEKEFLDFTHQIESPRDLTGILRIIFASEIIADASTISKDSFFKDKTYEQLQDHRYKRGFHIIALKRDNKWIYSFRPDFKFQEGDLIIGLGPKETVEQWRRCVHPNTIQD